LLLSQLDVEIHLAIGRTLDEEIAHGVGAHFLQHLAQRHHIAGTLGEPHDLAVPLEGHQLVENQRQPVRIQPEGLHHGEHARHVPLMIGAPHIDDAIEAPLDELVVVVGDIRGQNSQRAN
jgi:hypothetical protein